MNEKLSALIWIDLEMTGLDPLKDRIIEIATLITDPQLNIIAEGPSYAIHQSAEVLGLMDDWNQKQHGHSGLIARVQASNMSVQQAEAQTLELCVNMSHPKPHPCVVIPFAKIDVSSIGGCLNLKPIFIIGI